MPAKPRWLLHIPAIVQALANMSAPVVDRATCEWLFGVGRRRAIQIMRQFGGGYESGNTVLLDRIELMVQLRTLAADQAVAEERGRRQRLAQGLEEARRYSTAASVQIPVSREALERRLPELPAAVSFQAGRLVVSYSSPEDLLRSLYELAQAAAQDYEVFCQMATAAADRNSCSEAA